MELVVCGACKRHVAVAERACPFCANALAPQRPQYVRAASLTRAAIFSAAALASGCESKKSTPAPAPVPVQIGSAGSADDLEKLLDQEQPVADVPAASDGGVAIDGAVADAAVAAPNLPNPEDVAREKREAHEKRKKRLLEKQRREDQQKLELQKVDVIRQREMAKPYGAPPARRRVV